MSLSDSGDAITASSSSVPEAVIMNLFYVPIVLMAVVIWRNCFTIIDPTHSVPVERLRLSAAQPDLRIVQLSDIHADVTPLRGVTRRILRNALESVAAEQPDVVVLTGDYVNRNQLAIDFLESFITSLVKLVGAGNVIGVLGNHDAKGQRDSAYILSRLRQFGVTMLVNETVYLSEFNTLIVGLGDLSTRSIDYVAGRQSLDRTLADIAPSITGAKTPAVFVLSHNPDSIDDVARTFPEARLVLSGHTHGGQIRLPFMSEPLAPFYGAYVYPWIPVALRNFAPRPQFVIKNWKRCAGLFVIDGTNSVQVPRADAAMHGKSMLLYVSRGLGTHPPFRLFCPPEITVIDA
jgi:predicted MPP superfamily phosphohydrolase